MKIIEVNDSNIDEFNKLMGNPKQKAVVKIYADWCGHCKELNKKWPLLEGMFGKTNLSGIIASVPEHMMKKCKFDTEIRGFPSVRFLKGGKKKREYNGNREVKDLAKFIKKSLGKCRNKSKYKRKKPNKTNKSNKTNKLKKRRKNKTKKNKKKSRSAMRERFFRMISLHP
jgi:thioredoxin-like negative regulator of GroEL